MTQITAPETTPVTAAPVVKKIVPGAPPSVEKSLKKKRKAKSKPEDEPGSKPTPTERQIAAAPVSESAEVSLPAEDKKSPVIELLNKRTRNFTKKIVCAPPYVLSKCGAYYFIR